LHPKRLYSRVGESKADFQARCDRAPEEWADSQTAGLKGRFEAKIERVRDALATAERRVRELEADVGARKQQEVVAGAGGILSMFLAGKANTRSLSGFASRRSTTTRTQERLRSAAERVSDKEAAIDDLEDQLAEELSRIQGEADDRAEQIESLEVGLEKTDISVSEMALLWVPVAPREG
jgi:multidrug resistance efflux pump